MAFYDILGQSIIDYMDAYIASLPEPKYDNLVRLPMMTEFAKAFSLLYATEIYSKNSAFVASGTYARETYLVTTAASSFNATIPSASSCPGRRIKIIKDDIGAGIVTAVRTGTDTFNGATAFPMKKQYDFLEIESSQSNWYVIDSLSTLDSAVLSTAIQTLAHGLGARPRRVHTSLLCVTAEHGFVAGDEIFDIPNFYDSPNYRIWQVEADATNIRTVITEIAIWRRDASALALITPARWKFRIRCGV